MDLSSFIGRSKNTISINQLLRYQLLWLMLLRVVLYTFLLIISYIFPRSYFGLSVLPTQLFILLLFIVFLTSIFSAFLLLVFQGNLRKFGFVQTLFDTFFASLLVFFTGSSNSIFTTVYFFSIIAGGLILPPKGGLIAAAASTIEYGGLLFLESNGLYPKYLTNYLISSQPSLDVILNHFAVHGLVFFLAAILSALFGLRLKRTESALTDSIEKFDRLALLYKQIFDNISTGILTIDDQKTITSANNAIRRITGYDPLWLVGQVLPTIFPNIFIDEATERNTVDFEKKDGTMVRLGYSHMDIARTEDQQQPHKIITLRDISEIEKLERQVRQSEKLAAIGMMSASIAHDFRNPLTAISGSAQILATEFSTGTTKDFVNFELTNIILREANRMIEEISDFLKFSRPEHAKCAWFSLGDCIEEVIQVCAADPNWPNSLKVIKDYDPNLRIWADEKQLNTVFNQLLQNAKAFCPFGKERIVIEASKETATGEPEKQYIMIKVTDNGSGFAKNQVEQLFEPFFTTRPDGTGLGLAIIRQTIEAHGGEIQASNAERGGACFTLTLPLPYHPMLT
jgi:two-component system sensor histidine kinase PilS (NtrC family)